MEELAGVLNETGSFSSTQSSLEFVRTTVLERIESIIRISQRLEAAFMVDVLSSDMSLPGGQDRIAGTTEVGVGKSMRGGPDGNRRAEILLKTKVVLVRDVVGDGK